MESPISRFQFLFINDCIICLDDFERKSDKLADKDVLGLISQLSEQRDCSVALLLNSNTIPPGSDYFKYHEKIFDLEIELAPTPEEAAEFVFPSGDHTSKSIVQLTKSLNINNIRLLSKIKKTIFRISYLAEDRPEEVQNKLLSVICLAIWSLYGSSEDRVDIESIRNHNRHLRSNEKTSDERKPNQKENDRLITYGFPGCDEFSLLVIDLIEKGHTNEEQLLSIIDNLSVRARRNETELKIKEIKSKLENSMGEDLEFILDGYRGLLAGDLSLLQISEVDEICLFLDSLNETGLAINFAELYASQRATNHSPLTLSQISIPPTFPPLHSALLEIVVEENDETSFEDLVTLATNKDSYPDDITLLLSKHDTDDYYNLFKNHKDITSRYKKSSLDKTIRYCLNHINVDSQRSMLDQRIFNSIFKSSYEAILRIRSESRLNEIRTDSYFNFYNDQYLEIINNL